MDTGGLHELIDDLVAADPSCADYAKLMGWAAQSARLRAFCDERDLTIATGLNLLSARPDNDLADAGRMSVRHATTVLERAATVDTVPEFGAALGSGAITGAHVDVISRALRTLNGDERSALVAQAPTLIHEAQVCTATDFHTHVDGIVQRLQSDGGMAVYQRQRQATGLSVWTDKNTGMVRLSGRC